MQNNPKYNTYKQKLQEELEQQDDQALPDEDCPVHPNPAKEKAIRARGSSAAGAWCCFSVCFSGFYQIIP